MMLDPRVKLVRHRPVNQSFAIEVADGGGYRVRSRLSGTIWRFCETHKQAMGYIADARAGRLMVWRSA